MNNQNLKLILGALAALGIVAYLLGRNRGKTIATDWGGVTTDTDCQSTMSDNSAYEVASGFKSIFNDWYVSASDETNVKQLSRQIPDECGARKVHKYFGTLETTLYGTGDLNYFCRTRLTEQTKDEIRIYFGNTANF